MAHVLPEAHRLRCTDRSSTFDSIYDEGTWRESWMYRQFLLDLEWPRLKVLKICVLEAPVQYCKEVVNLILEYVKVATSSGTCQEHPAATRALQK